MKTTSPDLTATLSLKADNGATYTVKGSCTGTRWTFTVTNGMGMTVELPRALTALRLTEKALRDKFITAARPVRAEQSRAADRVLNAWIDQAMATLPIADSQLIADLKRLAR